MTARDGEKGFTLLEIVVAVTLVALLLSGVYGIFSGVSQARRRAEAGAELHHRGRVFFERLGRELRSLYVSEKGSENLFSCESRDGLLVSLSFATCAEAVPGQSQAGAVVVRYTLPEQGPASKTLSRLVLPLDPPEESGSGAATPVPFLDLVRELRLRFYAQGTWSEVWSSGAGQIPEQVEISLVLGDHEETVPLLTTLDLRR